MGIRRIQNISDKKLNALVEKLGEKNIITKSEKDKIKKGQK